MPIFLAVAAALTYGAADFLGGLASRTTRPPVVVVFSQLAGLLVLLLLLPFTGGHFSLTDLELGVACGISGAVAVTALYAALAVSRMGIVSPITAAVGAIVPVVFGLVIGERPSFTASVGVVLAFVAVVLVSTNEQTGRFSFHEPGVKLAVLGGVGMGALLVLMSRGRPDAGLWLLLPMRVTSIAIMTAWTSVRREGLRASTAALPTIVLAGVVDMSANVLYVLAARQGMLTIVAVITSLYPGSTVFLARLVLREKLAACQWVGVGLAAGAVVLIALGGRSP